MLHTRISRSFFATHTHTYARTRTRIHVVQNRRGVESASRPTNPTPPPSALQHFAKCTPLFSILGNKSVFILFAYGWEGIEVGWG